MRTIRLAVICLILLILMILMAANMTPVDLFLAPPALIPGLPTLPNVPVALIIISSLITGLLLGFLMEFAREHKHRAKLAEKRAELNRLREENTRLTRRMEREGLDLEAA